MMDEDQEYNIDHNFNQNGKRARSRNEDEAEEPLSKRINNLHLNQNQNIPHHSNHVNGFGVMHGVVKLNGISKIPSEVQGASHHHLQSNHPLPQVHVHHQQQNGFNPELEKIKDSSPHYYEQNYKLHQLHLENMERRRRKDLEQQNGIPPDH